MGADDVKSYGSLLIKLQESGACRHTLCPRYQDEIHAGKLQITLRYSALRSLIL